MRKVILTIVSGLNKWIIKLFVFDPLYFPLFMWDISHCHRILNGGILFEMSLMNHMKIKLGKVMEGKTKYFVSSFNLLSRKLLHDTTTPRGFLIY